MNGLFSTRNCIIALVAAITFVFASWTEDPPNFHTGAPGELTCQSCHVPPSSNASTGLMEIIGMPDTIVPNTNYTLTLRMEKTFGDASQAGFQMTIINESGRKIGALSNPSAGAGIADESVREYFEHRNPASLLSGNIAEWQVTWRSPKEEEAFSQQVRLFATGLLGNADSSVTGDVTIGTFGTSYFKSGYTKIAASFDSHPVTCHGGNDGYINVTVNGGRQPYSFTWSTGDTTQNLDSLKAGGYNLMITDDGIDTFVHYVSVLQPFPVFGEIIKTDIPCNSSVEAEAIVIPSQGVAPYTYLWSNGATTNTAAFSTAGPISVTVTDANGCTYVARSSIIRKGDFTATISNIVNANCNGGATGSATVAGNIPFVTSYLWSNGNTNPTATGLAAGDYSVTISNVDGCEARATVNIKEPSPIDVKINALNQPSCQGSYNGFISIFADGGVPPYAYRWEDGSTLKTLSTLIAGDYKVTVTDAFGCAVVDTITLTEPPLMSLHIDHLNESSPNANNGKANIIVSGGSAPYTYQWSDGAAGKDRSDLKPGFYTLTVTDVKGCTKEENLYIYPFACGITIEGVDISDVLCHGTHTGAVHYEISGGTLPFEFKWSNGKITQEAEQLAAGSYTVEITDADGCRTQGFFRVKTPPPLVRTLQVTDVTNPDFVDGEVKYAVSGGRAPYTIIFDVADSITTYSGIATFDNLWNGLHSSVIRDANGCEISEFFVVNIVGCTLNPGNVIIQDVKCFGESDGAICITVANAIGNYSVFWDDESSALCRTDLSAGAYNVHLEDDAGCQSLDTIIIKQPSEIRVLSLYKVIPPVGQETGTISVLLGGGVSPYRFEWTKDNAPLSEVTNALNNIGQGVYQYTAFDANDCVFIADTIQLIDPDLSSGKVQLNSLSIVPNPAHDLVKVTLPEAVSGKLSVVNMLGHQMLDKKIDHQDQIWLVVKSWPPGTYAIILHTNTGIYTGKVSVIGN